MSTTTDYQFKVLSPAEVDALRSIQKLIGAGNAEKGFHSRTQVLQDAVFDASAMRDINEITDNDYEVAVADLTDHVVATAALIDTEVSELIEEVRNGRAVNEVYFSLGDDKDVLPFDPVTGAPRKPEGVPAELADVEIRGFDFAERFDIDLAVEIDRKLAYNATRAFMHGKKL